MDPGHELWIQATSYGSEVLVMKQNYSLLVKVISYGLKSPFMDRTCSVWNKLICHGPETLDMDQHHTLRTKVINKYLSLWTSFTHYEIREIPHSVMKQWLSSFIRNFTFLSFLWSKHVGWLSRFPQSRQGRRDLPWLVKLREMYSFRHLPM